MKSIFKRIHLNYKQLVFLIIFILFSSIVQMLLPSFLSLMISNGVTLENKKAVIIIGIIMMIVTVVSCFVSFLSVKLATYISTDFSYQLRSKVFDKVQSFSAPEIDKFSTGSLITRSTSDITNIQNFITLLLRIGLIAPMMAAVGLFFSATTGGKISSVLLVSIPVLIILLSIVIIYASKYSIKLRSLLDRINTLFLESLEGVRVIRAFNKQNKESKKFNIENNNYAKISMISGRIGSLMMPIITLVFGFTTVAVLGLGSHYVELGNMEVASLVANSQYISMVLTSIMMLSLVIMMFPTSYACAKRVAEVLDTEPSIVDGNYHFNSRQKRNLVEFKNVTFAYPGASEPILKDISFSSGPREITAIIGGTGRGKSSILKLIPRLYDPMFGEILVDGVNIKEYKIDDLRSIIGYVPQKNILFNGDIASNLNFGNENGNEDDWISACEIACANEFINNKMNKYHEPISQGGSNLSGGQRQRMAIARAIMKKPEIYIFDDSFSALDMKTDKELRNNLLNNIGDATVIIVAQRISSIINADRILVIDDGKIVGNGKHEELLKTCPLYQEIAKVQLGKEME